MRKVRAIFVLGIWVAILPYLGFPNFWKNILFSLTGLFLMFLSYLLWKGLRIKREESIDSFTENSNFFNEKDPTAE